MKIEIEYWGMWNYQPNAASLAAELKESFNVDSELNAGSGGVFIVTVDGVVTYNKKETGQFPTKGEVTQIITSSN
jgi:selT/selW/selH-like putative selenoprotein